MSSARLHSGFALLAAALVWTAAAERGAAQGPPPGSPGATSSGLQANLPAISGKVVDAATGKPLAAVVSVRQGSGPGYRQATDDAGRFLFSNLAILTTYFVTAEKPGYLPGTLDAATALGPLPELRLTATEWLSNVEIKLIRESTMSGRVLDDKGEPLAGVRVVAQRRMAIAGDLRLVNGPAVTTDDRGHYRLPYLAHGEYVLMVPAVWSSVPVETPLADRSAITVHRLTPSGSISSDPLRQAWVSRGAHVLVDPGRPPPLPPLPDGRLHGFTTTFYPDVRSIDDARPITVAPGEQRVGVDIHLQPVALFSVSGSLAGPPGAGANVRLFLMPRSTEPLGLGHEAATTLAGADGRFTFPAVATGEYTIRAGMMPGGYVYPPRSVSVSEIRYELLGAAALTSVMSRAYRVQSAAPASEYSGRLAVSVGAADVTGVVVPLQRSGSIRGVLVQEAVRLAISVRGPDGIEFLSARRLIVRAEPADADPMLGEPQADTNASLLQAPFVLENVIPGEYVFSSVGHVKSVTWNGRDYTHVPLPVAPDSTVSGVVITTTSSTLTTRVQGVVRDAQGIPVQDATVIAFPVDPALWRRYGLTPRWLASQRLSGSRSSSRFTVTLPAGEYYLLALAEAPPETWMDATFLAKAATVATRVSLAWGEATEQDLTAVAVPR